MKFEVSKSPTDELSLKNCVVLHPDDIKKLDPKYEANELHKTYVAISGDRGEYIFAVIDSTKMKTGTLGLSAVQRRWMQVGLQKLVETHLYTTRINFLAAITFEADFLQKTKTSKDSFNTDKMLEAVYDTFMSVPFSYEQEIVFKFGNRPFLLLKVKELQAMDASLLSGEKPDNTRKVNVGILTANTTVLFDKKEESILSLTGKAKAKSATTSIINPEWDFSKMGIGGLDDEFSAIFRRAFASRVFPPEVIEQLGLQHVKGILLFGPPGTGKTLMARQIGKMLNAREPKIVNGPEILNKYVGESEANIRKLFEEAENEQKKMGANSGLHMIIFDEIDAICKQRGTVTGSTGVADTVVNQLLSKIDGVEQLNNILIIGMTNRKDLIDEALIRPGRLEVQMEIGLPSEEGRLQILNIHTARLKEHNKLENDVKLARLAALTKNYSGAEIEGLVRAATTTAMNKLVKAQSTVTVDPNAIENLKITNGDFLHAIENDIKPAFGTASEDSEHYLANGIIRYGEPVESVINDGNLLINQTRMGNLVSPVSVLLEGLEGSGKTSIAAHLAYKCSEFPFVKVVSPENMIGYSESAKCQAIKKIFDDAYKSELSCVIVDDIERLLDYVPIGPRFSNVVLQTLIVLLKKKLRHGRKLLIIGTSSCRDVLDQMQMLSCFNTVVHVPAIMNANYIVNVLEKLNHFTQEELTDIETQLSSKSICVSVKKLISLVEMAVQAGPEGRVLKLIMLLDEQCGKN
ncbi:vesicle-fusing ATPase-like [Hydractinia symbiolongicarpus]|uniref:vesicle-fusing ATPase-like n=1 Tax=Hydractinia symbiolongicarpus TaxID=13093 RepID=UPI00254F488F|nr:vesicle-fusing ATPase-like [Hydractinia symbiolongicarpus]